MLGGSRRTALKLHERADELLRELGASSAPVTDSIMGLLDAMGDYDEDAGEVITEAAKDIIKFTFMRGYTLRLASDRPIEVPMPDEDPSVCASKFMARADDDAWFYGEAFPQGPKVWERLVQSFAPVANAMLLEEQPDGPIFPSEVIDHVLRAGYMGGHVDEWFQLRPMYRDELSDATHLTEHDEPGRSAVMPADKAPATRLGHPCT